MRCTSRTPFLALALLLLLLGGASARASQAVAQENQPAAPASIASGYLHSACNANSIN